MRLEQHHQLSLDEARRRVTGLGNYWRNKYGVAVCWDGDVARINGSVRNVTFSGTLTVREKKVEAEATDPGLLMRTMATAYLKSVLAEYLDPAKKIEDLG